MSDEVNGNHSSEEHSPVAEQPAGSTTGEGPFADIEDVEREDDPFGKLEVDPSVSDEALFAAVDVEDIDEEELWAELTGGVDSEQAVTAAVDTPEVEIDADESVIPKRSYCERCQYFAAPPEVGCTHPGTEIRELVDTEHFRVTNCPVVGNRGSIDATDED